MSPFITNLLILFATILIGNFIYFKIAVFKKVSVTTIDEINASELSVSKEGALEEKLPEEIVNEKEASQIRRIANILFIFFGVLVWHFMSLTTGRIAYLLQPSDLFKIIVYFFIYFLFLRIPFGTINRTIMKSYELKIMPEKIIFALVMIVSYILGIVAYSIVPSYLKLPASWLG